MATENVMTDDGNKPAVIAELETQYTNDGRLSAGK